MTYLLDNVHELANDRFTYLQLLYDERSLDILDTLVEPADLVWLPGAGSGSLALPLADSVGRRGRIHVTDIDTRWFRQFPPDAPISAYRHDLCSDPYPQANVIHARLVLQHIPGWKALLPRLWDALVPGGFLVVEELDPITPYRPGAATAEHRLLNRVGNGFTALLGQHGADYEAGRMLPGTLAEAGFEVLGGFGYQALGLGTNHEAKLMQVNAVQTRQELVAKTGVTNTDIDRYLGLLNDPKTWFYMPVMYSVIARKEKP